MSESNLYGDGKDCADYRLNKRNIYNNINACLYADESNYEVNMSDSNYRCVKGWSGSSYVFIDNDGNWDFSDNKVIDSKLNICLHTDGILPDCKIARFGTHAVLYENNEMGDRDLTWHICEIFKGVWVLEGNDPLLQYQGDTVIKIQPLFELQHEGQ